MIAGCQKPAPIPQVSVAELRKELPVALRPARPEPAASENGWTLALPPKGKRLPKGDWMRLVGTDLIAKADHAEAHAALQEFEPHLGRLARALDRPRWRAPSQGVEIFNELATFKSLAKALVLRSEMNLEDGRPDAAIDDLLLVRTLSDRIASAEANVVTYLVAVAIRQIGNRALAEIVWDPRISKATLEHALKRVPDGATTDPGLADSLRGEAATFLDGLAKMHGPVDADSKGAVDQILKDHPNRLDARATVRLYGEGLGDEIANAGRAWKDQRASMRAADLLRDWPANVDDEASPPSDAQIRTARRALHGVPNALGRKLVANTLKVYEGLNFASFGVRASDSAMRLELLLALQAKGRSKNAGLPRDPFSGGAMKFDLARNVLWSVGPNGSDDGGSNPPYVRDQADLVWPIQPKRKLPPQVRSTP
ncbi:hypothetical protein EON77_01780 [bacterium]|nr:MAG: hypothetical protein EON77_01780 [bacterium]